LPTFSNAFLVNSAFNLSSLFSIGCEKTEKLPVCHSGQTRGIQASNSPKGWNNAPKSRLAQIYLEFVESLPGTLGND
jgi:hypothetical protein